MVDDDDDGRTTTDHGHPISSPCEPNGSGELIIVLCPVPLGVWVYFCYLIPPASMLQSLRDKTLIGLVHKS